MHKPFRTRAPTKTKSYKFKVTLTQRVKLHLTSFNFFPLKLMINYCSVQRAQLLNNNYMDGCSARGEEVEERRGRKETEFICTLNGLRVFGGELRESGDTRDHP